MRREAMPAGAMGAELIRAESGRCSGPRRSARGPAVLVVVEGEGAALAGDVWLEVGPGDRVVVDEGEPCGLRSSGGAVAAATWDAEGGMRMLAAFWEAALARDPSAPAARDRSRYGTPGGLEGLFVEAGLAEVRVEPIDVEIELDGFDDLWEPFTGSVGPASSYLTSLPLDAQAEIRDGCRKRLGDPDGAFRLPARAWGAHGVVPG